MFWSKLTIVVISAFCPIQTHWSAGCPSHFWNTRYFFYKKQYRDNSYVRNKKQNYSLIKFTSHKIGHSYLIKATSKPAFLLKLHISIFKAILSFKSYLEYESMTIMQLFRYPTIPLSRYPYPTISLSHYPTIPLHHYPAIPHPLLNHVQSFRLLAKKFIFIICDNINIEKLIQHEFCESTLTGLLAHPDRSDSLVKSVQIEVKWKPKAASKWRKNKHIDFKSSLLQKQKGKYRSCIWSLKKKENNSYKCSRLLGFPLNMLPFICCRLFPWRRLKKKEERWDKQVTSPKRIQT